MTEEILHPSHSETNDEQSDLSDNSRKRGESFHLFINRLTSASSELTNESGVKINSGLRRFFDMFFKNHVEQPEDPMGFEDNEQSKIKDETKISPRPAIELPDIRRANYHTLETSHPRATAVSEVLKDSVKRTVGAADAAEVARIEQQNAEQRRILENQRSLNTTNAPNESEHGLQSSGTEGVFGDSSHSENYEYPPPILPPDFRHMVRDSQQMSFQPGVEPKPPETLAPEQREIVFHRQHEAVNPSTVHELARSLADKDIPVEGLYYERRSEIRFDDDDLNASGQSQSDGQLYAAGAKMSEGSTHSSPAEQNNKRQDTAGDAHGLKSGVVQQGLYKKSIVAGFAVAMLIIAVYIAFIAV